MALSLSTSCRFDAAGTYEYTLVQVAGNADGVTYDSTEYAATITVTATADNTLTAAVSYAKDGETVDAATFANMHKAPRSLASRRSRLSSLVKPGTKPTKPSKPRSRSSSRRFRSRLPPMR